ncbi:MAG: hypothetical protein K2K48_07010 [Anaeroplasmataceae bacterium]|nr:hypothetical protein [Anaeroplasmataceae bacterium]MDE6415149.1 hypothetical protein [Anaeroplasmataceae bacterium]
MKTIVIIGSTGTIGSALASYFKNENCIEASRSLKTKENKVHLDLSDFRSVCDFIKRISIEKIDILFLNSGVFEEKKYTQDGYEYNFMVNAFSPYYIAKRVLELQPDCRIVLTSSISILHAKQELNPKNWKRIYRNTKLIEHGLLKNLEGLYPNSIFYAHPGIVPSRLSFGLHAVPTRRFIQLFGNTLEAGANCLIYASSLPSCKNTWVVPRGIFNLRGRPKVKKIKRSVLLKDEIKKTIIKMEKELEEKYGI